MKIIWSPLSVERLADISGYIADNNHEASIKWVESVFQIIEQLEQYPESGRVVSEINKSNIRELIFRDYRIIYKIHQEEIYILTIRHFKQILPHDDVN